MARNRIIKPEFYADEKLTAVSIEARFLFMGLVSFAEDMGRRRYNPARIKNEVFPADDEITTDAIDSFIGELEQVEIIELYEVNHKRYIRIPHFLDHQYVRKPSHCVAPPSPKEGPDAVTCLCANCVIERGRNGRRNVPAGTVRTGDALEPHSDLTSDSPVTHHSVTSASRVSTGIGIGIGFYDGKSREAIHTGELDSDRIPSKAETTAEDRRARLDALTKIAGNILAIFEIEPNSNVLSTLVRSIEIRARSKAVSEEAAAQEISARAAWIAGQAAPEDWLGWFYDARYAYVPQGDKALRDPRIEARPVCGGARCSEGWETVRVGDRSVSRRCPDCVRLWREAEG